MNKNIFLLSSVLMATTATTVRANEVQTTLTRVNSSYIQKRTQQKPQAMTMV